MTPDEQAHALLAELRHLADTAFPVRADLARDMGVCKSRVTALLGSDSKPPKSFPTIGTVLRVLAAVERETGVTHRLVFKI